MRNVFDAALRARGTTSRGFSLSHADSRDSPQRAALRQMVGQMQWKKRIRYLKLLRVGNFSINPEEMNPKEW